MSTRCNIIIRGNEMQDVILYRHSDGYPSEMIDVLKESMKDENELKTIDYLIKNGNCRFTTDIHGDIEYLYIIYPKYQSLDCFKYLWESEL